MKKILLVLLVIMGSQISKAQSVLYSETFTNGQTYCPGSTNYDNWGTFRAALDTSTLTFTSATIRGSLNTTGITCVDAAVIAQIADALRTGTQASFVCDGTTWTVGTACLTGCAVSGDDVELNAANTGSDCSCGGDFTLRPAIGNANWGSIGVGGCGAATQTMEVEFVHANAPVVACPMDVVTDNDPGVCGAVVSFADAVAIDVEDGVVATTQTAGLPSGSVFPIGDSTVEFSATDSDGNTGTCSFVITVNDNEAPVAVCQDITIELDAMGMATIVAADIDNGSSDNCTFTLSADITSFDCSNLGANTVELTVTDDAGNTATCNATVTVEDVTAPVITCIGQPINNNVGEDFEDTTIPTGWTSDIAVGVQDWEFGSGDLPTGDDFSTFAAIFNDDAAGSGEVNVGTLSSPVYDLSAALSANLSYEVAFQEFGDQEFAVEVWDGAAWVQVALYDEDLDPDIQAESFDVSAYMNAAFQVRFAYDDLGGWGWHAAIDNFAVDFVTTGTPLSVVLDANGMASINASDLILSVEDSCGTTVTVEGDNSCSQSLASNAFEGGYFTDPGNGFIVGVDLIVDADVDFTMNQITANLFHDVGATIATIDLVYYEDNAGEPGTEIGTETGLAPTSQAVVGNNFGFDVSETVFDITPFTFASSVGVPTTYWVSASVTSSTGGTTAWETQTAAVIGNDALSFDGTLWNNPAPGSDAVYTFSGECGTAVSATIDFDCSNLGENQVEVTVMDESGNTSTCTATVIVSDETAPILVCADATIELGEDGTAVVDPEALLATLPSSYEVITISSDNQSGTPGNTDFTVDVTADETVSFDWSYSTDDGPGFDGFGYLVNGVYTEVTDPAGTNNQTGSTTVALLAGDVFGFRSSSVDGGFGAATTVISNFMPGFEGQFDPANWTLDLDNSDGDAFFVEIPGGPLSFDACGITVLAVDVTEVTCADIGTPITVTVFASDASGNIAACTAVVTVVDLLGPVITCPADQTVDPGEGNLFYEVPDYFATGEATVTDNCTDPVTITSQDPAPGELISDGVYTVTLTAEDEYGNIGECTFELTVESVLGLDDNKLDSAISMYPNPAHSNVTISNSSNISLEKAAIYDTNGRLIQTINLRDMQQEKTFDVSALATGVYMVQIQGENATATKRLVKE